LLTPSPPPLPHRRIHPPTVTFSAILLAFDAFDANGDGVVDLYECVELLFPARVNAREEVAAQYVARDLEKKGVRSKSLADASTDVMSAVMKIAHVIFDREIKLKKVRGALSVVHTHLYGRKLETA
jgi:hypothetical protein